MRALVCARVRARVTMEQRVEHRWSMLQGEVRIRTLYWMVQDIFSRTSFRTFQSVSCKSNKELMSSFHIAVVISARTDCVLFKWYISGKQKHKAPWSAPWTDSSIIIKGRGWERCVCVPSSGTVAARWRPGCRAGRQCEWRRAEPLVWDFLSEATQFLLASYRSLSSPTPWKPHFRLISLNVLLHLYWIKLYI